jgi:antitoxin YefM
MESTNIGPSNNWAYFCIHTSMSMKVISYTHFRNNLTQNLNTVNNDKEVIVVSRTNCKSVVVMDLDEYNSLQETMHLTSTKANRKRLDESIAEMKKGKWSKHSLSKK